MSSRRRGILDDTLLIVTADHGEQFGEHGDFGHGFSVYQAEVHVPLLIHFPRKVPQGYVVREAVSLRHVPSTVLELAGLDAHSPFPGKSLSAFWIMGASDRAHATQGRLSRSSPHRSKPRAPGPLFRNSVARCSPWSLAGMPSSATPEAAEELYDLESDPEERSNLIDSANVELVGAFAGCLKSVCTPSRFRLRTLESLSPRVARDRFETRRKSP